MPATPAWLWQSNMSPEGTGDFRTVKLLCVTPWWWIHVIMHRSKPTECTTQRVNFSKPWTLVNKVSGASLVAQWLRMCLPMQGTRVQALAWEEPTCRGATRPMCHNYWACALEPASHNCWAQVPQLLKPVRLEPVLHNKRSHCNEKSAHRNKE